MLSPYFTRKQLVAITDINTDIIETHILSKLDGHSLASLAATSSHFYALCSKEKVWAQVCNSTWPSTKHPTISTTISNFNRGHRSFFSHSFPVLTHTRSPSTMFQLSSTSTTTTTTTPPARDLIISAVDIFYNNKLVYTKIHVTDCFLDSTFQINLFNYEKEFKTIIPLKFGKDDCRENDMIFMNDIKENMGLSWIIVDPALRRASNLSSWKPVSVEWHCDGGDIEVKYATTTVDGGDIEDEVVEFRVVVMLGLEGDDQELEMRSVKLELRDMDDKCLRGRDSLVIFQDIISSSMSMNPKKGKKGEVTETYNKFVNVKRIRREEILLQRRRKMGVVTLTWSAALVFTFAILILLMGFALRICIHI